MLRVTEISDQLQTRRPVMRGVAINQVSNCHCCL